jgi:hypothetical protein
LKPNCKCMKIGIVGTYAHLITYLSIFQSNWNNFNFNMWLKLHPRMIVYVACYYSANVSCKKMFNIISFSYFTNKENSIMLCLKTHYFCFIWICIASLGKTMVGLSNHLISSFLIKMLISSSFSLCLSF